ncbi:glycosyltransferase [Couchioplanes caeruleus]|uniref:glycosyltransferase n=1 Tax=Couchioplanes caeruleus TaxID=56438 RepID=UPI0020BE158F|nr:glycosyltransferase [Couchioplanes caeruleus]UQU62402.1 glycosyltransferase [Couchioplanes caeruleus]
MTVAHLIAVPPFVVAGPAPRDFWSRGQAAVEFTVVIPFHNPGASLRPTVERLAETLYAQNISFEMIAVSGGSIDGSEHSLADLPWIRVINDPDVRDKGAALQTGAAAAQGAWVGVVDVDGDAEVDPYELIECLHRARENEAALV